MKKQNQVAVVTEILKHALARRSSPLFSQSSLAKKFLTANKRHLASYVFLQKYAMNSPCMSATPCAEFPLTQLEPLSVPGEQATEHD